MCTCASCKHTDALAGWKDDGAGNTIPDFEHGGFDRWPRGNPAGKRSSEAAYAAHVRHCGGKMPAPYVYEAPDAVSFYGTPPGISRAEVRRVLRQSFGLEGETVAPSPSPAKPAPVLRVVAKSAPVAVAVADDLADFIRRRMAA